MGQYGIDEVIDENPGAADEIGELPLHGLTVADFGVGMAAALAAKFLAETGADVRRIEPDGDPFYAVYPAYATWRSCLADVAPYSPERERDLLARADVCIVGGEDFPGFETRHDAAALAAAHPGLIVLDIAATLPDSGLAPLHAADLLVQARTGLVFESYPDRPAAMGFVPSAYGAALTGLIAVCAALYQREGDGRGQVVRAGLLEGALAWLTPYWGRADTATPLYRFNVPRGARPLLLRTLDDSYVHVVLGSSGAKYKLYRILGIDDPSILPSDPGLPDVAAPPDQFFGDLDLLAPYAAKLRSDDLLAALADAGVVSERALPPGKMFDDPQAMHNGIVRHSPAGTAYVGPPVTWRRSAGGSRPSRDDNPGAPLAGIRVLDFGAFVAGPAASVGLADLGAEVIKIEPPQGDPVRGSYTFYAAANRGKRSIAIEMKSEDGLKLAHRLARQADIVCSNFRTGVAERLGIDAATLHAGQPEKIVLNNAGYGVTGPKASHPAFDPCMQATCGHEVRAGGCGNPPALNRTMMVDFAGALLGQIGVMIALYRRRRDGSGSAVTVPLLNAGMFLGSDVVRSGDGAIRGDVALLADQTGYHPAEKLYQARDGWIAVAARGETAARALAETFGLAALAARPRRSWSDDDALALASAIAPLDMVEALAVLQNAGVPAEQCRDDMASVFIADDRLVANGRVYEAGRPVLGKVRGLGRLYSLSSDAPMPQGSVSEKGEDGRAILAEAGLSIDEIAALYAAKVALE